MISKLPRWFWSASGALAFMAGIINVVGFLGFEHQAITHLTGTTSMLAVALAGAEGARIAHCAAAIAAFILGNALSGFIIQDSPLQLNRRYGLALLLESLLLITAVPLLRAESLFGMYLAACACGLQNAMVSTYSGMVVRTTHVSGMFTDLGICLGHAARGLPVDFRRVRLCALVITGFLGGGIIGALAFQSFSYNALFIPAAFTTLMSLAYGLSHVRKTWRPHGA